MFFGTPAIAVPALEALCAVTEVVGVICQPDRPAGRGLAVQAPAVKQAAEQRGLPVHQPTKVRTGTVHEWLRERRVDVAVVMAYGRILPAPVLQAPARGCLNLHASVLPRYRGAAPIQWAILEGETETGVSLMQMDEGLDTGPVLAVRRLEIRPNDTTGSLSERLANLAAEVVRLDLPAALRGELSAEPQRAELATYAPLLGAKDARLDFTRPASEVVRRVRAMAPRPGASTLLCGKRLRVTEAAIGDLPAAGPPGRVTLWDRRRVLVATPSGSVEILRAQLEGRRELSAQDLANGRVLGDGDVLGA